MNKRQINRKIRAKFNEYVSSIKDTKVRGLVRDNTIITGGCIASMLLNEDVNDYDIYFRNKETLEAVLNYYVDRLPTSVRKNYKVAVESSDDRVHIHIQSSGYIAFKDYSPYVPIYITDNALTLTNDIQIIQRFYGEAEDIHEGFDFVHCTNYWDSKKGLVLNGDAIESILTKELRYIGSRFPICSLIRTRKFIKRGWNINAGQYLKMCFQVNELDLNSIQVLEDQLIGVDTYFFQELLARLKEGTALNGGDNLDTSYVVDLIDEVFNGEWEDNNTNEIKELT